MTVQADADLADASSPQLLRNIPALIQHVTVTVGVNPNRNGTTAAFPYPPRNLQQNIQPRSRLTKTAENHLTPTPQRQSDFQLSFHFGCCRLPFQFQVEAANALLEIAEAEPTVVRATVSYVQVKAAVQPIGNPWFFPANHALPP